GWLCSDGFEAGWAVAVRRVRCRRRVPTLSLGRAGPRQGAATTGVVAPASGNLDARDLTLAVPRPTRSAPEKPIRKAGRKVPFRAAWGRRPEAGAPVVRRY